MTELPTKIPLLNRSSKGCCQTAIVQVDARAGLNMVRTVQQNFSPDLSIGLLRDQIGHYPRILTSVLP